MGWLSCMHYSVVLEQHAQCLALNQFLSLSVYCCCLVNQSGDSPSKQGNSIFGMGAGLGVSQTGMGMGVGQTGIGIGQTGLGGGQTGMGIGSGGLTGVGSGPGFGQRFGSAPSFAGNRCLLLMCYSRQIITDCSIRVF